MPRVRSSTTLPPCVTWTGCACLTCSLGVTNSPGIIGLVETSRQRPHQRLSQHIDGPSGGSLSRRHLIETEVIVADLVAGRSVDPAMGIVVGAVEARTRRARRRRQHPTAGLPTFFTYASSPLDAHGGVCCLLSASAVRGGLPSTVLRTSSHDRTPHRPSAAWAPSCRSGRVLAVADIRSVPIRSVMACGYIGSMKAKAGH